MPVGWTLDTPDGTIVARLREFCRDARDGFTAG
jgi:hypothetical protein